jgi:gliding motility-associated lipoprotein GldH
MTISQKANSFLCYAIVLLFVILIMSCDSKRVYENNVSIENQIWNNKNKIQFTVDITDTQSLHNVYVNIRNAGDYTYSNIYLFLKTYYPKHAISVDTLECILADPNGKWLGNGSGDIWDNQILFKKNVKFKEKGIYTFEYEQAMRVEQLPQILDVGLRIEKTN